MLKILSESEIEKNFAVESGNFSAILDKLEKKVNVRQEWSDFVSHLKFNTLEKNFLENPTLLNTMVATDPKMFVLEFKFIESKYSESLEKLKLVTLGAPKTYKLKGNSYSSNDIHHLYHLKRYQNTTGCNNLNIKSVIEWGGGYGNFCKIMLNEVPSIERYTIIDLPTFIAIDAVYLGSIFGSQNVHIINKGERLRDGINLIPSNIIEDVNVPSHDMFITTWALSESPLEYQDFLKEVNWYNCKRFLMSFHQCGHHIPFMKESTILKENCERMNLQIEDVQVIPGINYYGFK